MDAEPTDRGSDGWSAGLLALAGFGFGTPDADAHGHDQATAIRMRR
jgi:hypothetical protein